MRGEGNGQVRRIGREGQQASPEAVRDGQA